VAAHRFETVLQAEEGGPAVFVEVPDDVRDRLGSKRAPVRGTINGTPFRSTIAVYGARGLIPVPRRLRERAGIAPGEGLVVELERDDEPREVDVPPDLEAALAADERPARRSRSSPTATARSTSRGSRRRCAPRRAAAASSARSESCARGRASRAIRREPRRARSRSWGARRITGDHHRVPWEAGRVTDFIGENLIGSRFEDIALTNARFHHVDLSNARLAGMTKPVLEPG
jgi:hypothetical protein